MSNNTIRSNLKSKCCKSDEYVHDVGVSRSIPEFIAKC